MFLSPFVVFSYFFGAITAVLLMCSAVLLLCLSLSFHRRLLLSVVFVCCVCLFCLSVLAGVDVEVTKCWQSGFLSMHAAYYNEAFEELYRLYIDQPHTTLTQMSLSTSTFPPWSPVSQC